MKKSERLKKYIIISCVVVLFFTGIFIFFSVYQYRSYTKNFNKKLNLIALTINEKYEDISENELMEIFNKEDSVEKDYFKKYGIDITRNSVIIENTNNLKIYILVTIILMFLFSGIIILMFLKYNRKKDKDILEIESYIERINADDYSITIDNNTEEELSILKNEVYKTMIKLRENALNQLNDKMSIKTSIEDISHQIKTPLTSIVIAIDTLDDNPDLDFETKERFIKIIKKNTMQINFLIQTILKLSKFDTNTFEYNKTEESILTIVKESMENVENLSEIKNVKIRLKCDKDYKIVCDKYWQIEAITNVLKNAVEHAYGNVDIEIENNSIYLCVVITNDGKSISKKDLPHIFERFYKSVNFSSDSVGIGLSLTKAILDNSNASISVDSIKNKTSFKIKYFK